MSDGKNPIDVAAALIFRDGRILVAQRPTHSHLGGLWEFPGGKREPGESFEQCLIRELREELGVGVKVGGLFEEITHVYPDKSIRLKFFLCELIEGKPQPIDCAAVRWASKPELADYDFPAADARLLGKLLAYDFP